MRLLLALPHNSSPFPNNLVSHIGFLLSPALGLPNELLTTEQEGSIFKEGGHFPLGLSHAIRCPLQSPQRQENHEVQHSGLLSSLWQKLWDVMAALSGLFGLERVTREIKNTRYLFPVRRPPTATFAA